LSLPALCPELSPTAGFLRSCLRGRRSIGRHTPSWVPSNNFLRSERASCAEALKHNYEVGPPADWANSYISSYATMHPWEDWAETWAHYLHVMASLGTALGFGLEASDLETEIRPFTSEDLYAPE